MRSEIIYNLPLQKFPFTKTLQVLKLRSLEYMIPGDGLTNGTSDSFDIHYPMVYNISNTIDDDTLSKSCDYTQLEKH